MVQTETLSAEQEKLAHPSAISALGPGVGFSGRTLLDGDLALVPAHDIGPLLASMLLADLTSLLSVGLAVTDDSDGRIVVLVTDSDPGNTVGCLSVSYSIALAKMLTVVPVISVFTVAVISIMPRPRQELLTQSAFCT